jgi:hypothetical protein
MKDAKHPLSAPDNPIGRVHHRGSGHGSGAHLEEEEEGRRAAWALLKLCGKTPFFLKPLSHFETADLGKSQLSTGKSKRRGLMISSISGEIMPRSSPYKSEQQPSVVLMLTANDQG